MQQLREMEAQTEQGKWPWVYFYTRAISTIDAMEPAAWLSILKQHYSEMRPYAQALADGKINAQEFFLIRDKSIRDIKPSFEAAYKSTPYLVGEKQRAASDAAGMEVLGLLGGILLGASLANTTPAPAPPINCNSYRVGSYINTSCR